MERKVKWTNEVAYAMTLLRILSWPLGTWPLQDYNVFSTVRSTVSILALILMIATVYAESFLNNNDADKTIDTLMYLSSGVLAFTKITSYRMQARNLIVNFTSAVEDYRTIDTEEKRLIVRWHAFMSRVTCAILIFFSYFSTVVLIIMPLLTMSSNVSNATKVEYPMPSATTLLYLNVPENWYLMIFLVQCVMLLVCVTGNLGSDGLFFGITFHVCGQVEVLKTEFEGFVATTEKTFERYAVLIKRHRYLLDMAEKLADTINFMLIIQLFLSCLLICVIGFQCILALKFKNIGMLIKTIMIMGTLLTQLFGYSYVGDYLKCQMEDLGLCVYCSSWYNFPGKVANNVVFVIMRAQHPVQLTAGRFFVVNMETYMNILRTSLSYLSVLRVMINDD